MKTVNKPTYISLFSSAGVGCYGFKLEGFDCVATNELITRRLEIQKFNQKCKYESGYICGDITKDDTKKALYDQIAFWKKKENLSRVDVVIATPPCQGMSVANHKKSKTEIVRNSLVIESIKIIKQINPRFFIFENVPAFMKTICTDVDGEHKTIASAIENNLGKAYSYTSRVINFKNFGACSSRQRTVIIGVSKDFADEISPLELYPNPVKERTLREVIGELKPLKEFGEIDKNDIYHSFRTYPEHMRTWIADIKEGQSAFDNIDDNKKPHRIIDGKIVINQRKNADKYTRQYWDKVGPCIHTRNDQMASQNTVHPCDDRVFSIRELMLMMTVPYSFKWVETDFDELNSLSERQKRAFLKKEEIKIRQSLGEAVPTVIFQSIAKKIADTLKQPPLSTANINKLVSSYELSKVENLRNFIVENSLNLSAATLGKIAELANTGRTDNAAFFTSKSLITEMMKALPETDKDTVRILEPSVGVGNFLPLIIKKFEGKNIILDVVDIDLRSLELAELILAKYNIPDTCIINYIHDDFLLHNFEDRYDYIIGNPPFFKMKSANKLLNVYRHNAINKATTNICSFFLDKAINLGNYVALVFPKFLLNTPEFADTREYLSEKAIECIIDFGEKGFPGVLVETLAIFINNLSRPSNTRVASVTRGKYMSQSQKYIFDEKLPYWIIYRDVQFDSVCKKLDFNVFKVFRDRQITNAQLSDSGDVRVLKSRNISDDGKSILDLSDYDSYIDYDALKGLAVFEYLDRDDVYLTPNMTYKPRVIRKPKNCVVNGSVAILIPKNGTIPTDEQMDFFSTPEYREFYQVARNYQTRSLNVDSCSVFFYGLLRSKDKKSSITEKFNERDNNAQLTIFDFMK
ncbi:MAG: DNA cytosine methyltransferase [Bacteroidales bacterium]|nr:DNA cytosine methyltransferase [Clostridium sp.]MCM1203447.1 DNA cytosine methyltransferase [Bacteroidales bacterium]